MIDAMSPGRTAVRETAAIMGSLVLVVGAAAALLRLLDAAPRLIGGDRPGVVRFESIDAAERAFGEPLFLPAFFPDTLRWPPAAVRFSPGPPPSVALGFASRADASVRLEIYEARGVRALIPMALMPAGVVLYRTDLPFPDGDAALYRLRMPDGSVRNDVVWHRATLTIALRYAGGADEVVGIARSLRRRRP